MSLQPFLHESVILLRAPTQAILQHDGVMGRGADGVYHLDTRVISKIFLETPHQLDFIGTEDVHADEACFHYLLRDVGEPTPDATVTVVRHVQVDAGAYRETIAVHNHGTAPITVQLSLHGALSTDRIDDVKVGRAEETDSSILATQRVIRPSGMILAIDATGNTTAETLLEPGGTHRITCELRIETTHGDLFAAGINAPELLPMVSVDGDVNLNATLRRSVEDLRGLLLAETDSGRTFIAAGAPWYFTLFGRDSLWAARFLLPLGPRLATDTLAVLAGRQALEYDAAASAEPGKILHEVRSGHMDLGGGVVLPPVYYGSIDATLLWLILLQEAWHAGADDNALQQLMPAARAALEWMHEAVSRDDAGFLRYIDASGRGLANQGWKDSADGIRDEHGNIAKPPIALCEVQAYAVQAARAGADILEAFGAPSEEPARWRAWATDLTARFRSAFWTDDAAGPLPASAIDGTGKPIRSVTSNIGHLLGTGLLTSDEATLVARRLLAPDMFTGFGLRTLSANAPGYNPFGYHTGAVWTHDTMIAARGLDAEGLHDEALQLVEGIMAAATSFGHRVPELFAGIHRTQPGVQPLPYPASCRPQGWSAAATIEALRIMIGMTVKRTDTQPRLDKRAVPLPRGSRIDGLKFHQSAISFIVNDQQHITAIR